LAHEDIDLATAEVVRMSRLVNGLLTLARAEAAVGTPERLSVSEIVSDRFEVWRAVAAERGVELRAGSVDEHVLASPGNLEQVLDNVLSNALDVSPDGGTITVRARRVDDQVELEISDEGPGLPPADRLRAFDRFWRGPGTTGPSGSGLGLAIVKQLVSDDGGTVGLTDAAGGGLCVRISLRASPTSGG
jgi:signal transduction histidine kinase